MSKKMKIIVPTNYGLFNISENIIFSMYIYSIINSNKIKITPLSEQYTRFPSSADLSRL